MKRTFLTRATIFVVAAFSFGMVSSCVDADYELSEERLNTEVTLFQEGLTLPIGTTAPLELSSLLDRLGEETRDFLASKDGAYLFRMADSLDFSEQMAGLTDVINIEKIEVQEKLPFNLSNVDLSSLTIDVGEIKSSEFDVAGMVNIPDIKLPEIKPEIKPIETKVPLIRKSDLNLNFEKNNLSHLTSFANFKNEGDSFTVPDYILNNKEISEQPMEYAAIAKLLQGQANLPNLEIAESFAPYTMSVPVRISLPKGINSVEEITLDKDAVVKVDIAMHNSLFTEGEIDPDIDIDLHNLFHLKHGETGVTADDHLKDHFVISHENNWHEAHTYYVESLAVEPKDFIPQDDGSLLLEKNIEVTAQGSVQTTGLKTTISHLHHHNDEAMDVTIDLKFENFSVENVKMTIDEIAMSRDLTVPVKVDAGELPDVVEQVEYVDLKNPLTLDIESVVPEEYKSMFKLDRLEIKFPSEFVVEHKNFNAETNTLLFENVLLADGLKEKININRLNLPQIVDGKLSYDKVIEVHASASPITTINSKEIMSESSEKEALVKVNMNVEYKPEIADYSVVIKDYVYDVKIDPITFDEPLPSDVGEVGKISVFLEKGADGKNPAVVINLDYPGVDPEDSELYDVLKILPKEGEGLKVKFAEEIVFEGLPSTYNHNPEDNSINFKDDQQIPSTITLPISRLDIVPEMDKDGNYRVSGAIEITGGVRLEGMTVKKALIDQLKADKDTGRAKVSFSADVPVLKPAKLNVGEYVALIDETIEFGGINIGDLPDMVKSVGDVTLKDVELNLEVDASSIASVISDVDMTLEMDVKLPEIIVIDHEDVDKNNVLHVEKKMQNNKFKIGPYHVEKLDLSGVDLTADEISLGDMKIEIDGRVVLKNADVDLGHLGDKDLEVKIDGTLCSRGTEEILIDKINAVVDYKIDPVRQSIDLSALSGSLSGNMDLSMDLNRFNIVLEVKTNLGVPVEADLEIVPYKDGSVMEGKILKPDQPLTLKYSSEAKDTVYTRYWISNTEEGKPADYEWVDLDLLQILKDMPDSVQLSLNAGTTDNASFAFEPESKYALSANYAFELPLELGEDFKLEFADTLSGLPSQLSTVLSHGSLALGGKVTSSLPVQLEVTFNLLDAEGERIELAEDSGKTLIGACHLDGSPATSDLNVKLKIKEGIEIPEISAIEMKFKATSGGHMGAFREDSFIQVELNAQIPDGVTVDLKDLMQKAEDDESEDVQ